MILQIHHIKQSGGTKDKLYWEKRTCGLTCIKMFFEYMENKSPSFDELISFKDSEFLCLSFLDGKEKRYRFFTPESGWLHYGLISIIRKYGYNGIFERSYTKENAFEKIESQIHAGYFVISSVNRYPEYKGKKRGHLVVVAGIEKIGNKSWIIINDPARKNGNTRVTKKTFLKNFNYCSILLKKEAEEKFLANYPTYIDKMSVGNSKNVYINVHENEKLAFDETREFIDKNSGILLGIHQNGERFLRYEISSLTGEKVFLRIDPNRIFDDENLSRTIKERNSHLNEDLFPLAFEKGLFIRDYILKKIEECSPENVIGIHTNKLLSINNCISKTPFVSINKDMSENAFIQTTDKNDFERLSKLGINCVYFEKGEHDGSLGDYYQSKGIRYFTIETGTEDKQTFRMLLETLQKII